MRGRSLVPGRLQSMAEVSHEFVASMLRESTGEAGMKYFPLVFTLFIFIFVCNMLGMIPGAFTVTSHIIVTAALAALVFLTVLIVGFAKNGFRFLKLFVPEGVPILILPLVVLIEIISFLSRPVSHSVRLFANMLAGHITLKVFGGFVVMLLSAGTLRGAVAAAAADGRGADRARGAGGVPAGLRLHHAHLHVSQRRASSGTLDRGPPLSTAQPTTGRRHPWIPPPRSSSAPALPPSARELPPSASATCSASSCRARLRNPSAADGQFGRLIFGFAVTEALGIFALLIAFLLLFT